MRRCCAHADVTCCSPSDPIKASHHPCLTDRRHALGAAPSCNGRPVVGSSCFLVAYSHSLPGPGHWQSFQKDGHLGTGLCPVRRSTTRFTWTPWQPRLGTPLWQPTTQAPSCTAWSCPGSSHPQRAPHHSPLSPEPLSPHCSTGTVLSAPVHMLCQLSSRGSTTPWLGYLDLLCVGLLRPKA